MADTLQVIDVTPLTRPVRFATKEAWYAASAGTLYLSGASDVVSNVLAKPVPKFLRRVVTPSNPTSVDYRCSCCTASATTRVGPTNSSVDSLTTASSPARSTTTHL